MRSTKPALLVEHFRFSTRLMQEDGKLMRINYKGRRKQSESLCSIDLIKDPLDLTDQEMDEYRNLPEDVREFVFRIAGHVEISNLPYYERETIPKEYRDSLYLYDLNVDPKHRRIGLGSKLVNEGKRFATRNQSGIFLIPSQATSIGFSKLLEFYEKNEFFQFKENPRFLYWEGGK